MPKTKHPTTKEMLGPLPPVRRRKTPTPEENQLAQLDAYVRQHWPPPGNGFVYATVVGRVTELLDKLRAYEKQQAEESRLAREQLDQARANSVKTAVARLIGGYQKISAEELKKLAIEMCADEEFWRELNWQTDRVKKLIGPYY